ncbi:MAG: MFS transporter [Coriobacteriales bacterium]|jgi:DHA3 family macrolide efflux protein-like MFS transporter|nr:MFS transporter [Coriobacteriales bacterium]
MHVSSELSASGRPLPENWLRIISFIWGGQAVSVLTTYAAGYASIWYFTETTNSPLMLSIATIAILLPTGLLSPYGGVLADRFNRRTIMLLADGSVGLLSLVLGIIMLLGEPSLALIMVLVLGRAIGQAFHGPAMTAAMPLLVPGRHLVRINALDQILLGIGATIGPALGIFLYTTIGFAAALFLDAAGAVVACLALSFAKIPTVRDKNMDGRTVLANMLDGWHVIKRNKGLLYIFAFATVGLVLFMPISALFPLMTYSHFGGDGFMASLVEAVWGGCLLVGSGVLLVWGGGQRLARLVIIAGIGIGITTLVCGLLAPNQFVIFVILSGVMALFGAFFQGPLITIVQRESPEDKLGRVMGLCSAAMSIAPPIGLIVSGIIAERTGVAWWFFICGLLIAVLATPAYFLKPIKELDSTPRTHP